MPQVPQPSILNRETVMYEHSKTRGFGISGFYNPKGPVVLMCHILWPQSRPYAGTSGPKYLLYWYMDPDTLYTLHPYGTIKATLRGTLTRSPGTWTRRQAEPNP